MSSRSTVTKSTPSGPPLDSLPFFGTSWYRRSVSYWVLRLLAAFIFIVISAIVFAMAAGITVSFINDGTSPWIVIPIALCVALASTFHHGKTVIRYQRERAQVGDTTLLTSEKPKRRSRGVNSGAAGFLLSGLGGLGSIVVILAMPFAIGVFPWLLYIYLKPLAPGELRARRKVAKWLELHGRQDEIPAGWSESKPPA